MRVLDAELLRTLATVGPCSSLDLSTRLGVERGKVHEAMHWLGLAGMVILRGSRWVLTKKGRLMLEREGVRV